MCRVTRGSLHPARLGTAKGTVLLAELGAAVLCVLCTVATWCALRWVDPSACPGLRGWIELISLTHFRPSGLKYDSMSISHQRSLGAGFP